MSEQRSVKKKRNPRVALETAPPITSIKDLIQIGNSIKRYSNIDSVMVWRIAPYLEELEALVGMASLKKSIFYQLVYYVQGMHLRNKEGEYLHTMIMAGPGQGKCLALDTRVLMYDGTVKKVQDVGVNDSLMGDDSKPRTVLSTCRGRETMYKVHQKNGDAYVVNESHILSLKLSKSPRIEHRPHRRQYNARWHDSDGRHSKTFTYKPGHDVDQLKAAEQFIIDLPQRGSVIDISIEDYVTRSASWKTAFKGYKVSVDFPPRDVDLDPYVLGYWLGDGTSDKPQITTVDEVVVQYFREYFSDLCVVANATGITYDITSKKRGGVMTDGRNRFVSSLRKYGVMGNKHVPTEYAVNSRDVRLGVLAGLLDADGWLDPTGVFSIVQKREELANDIVYIARSLGLRATISPVTKSCMYKGERRTGEYHAVYISGHLDMIPTKLARKQALERKSVKDPLVYGVTLERLDEGDYYGFSIDGNERFMLGDFTVTHNTTVARIIGKLYQAMGVLSARGPFRIAHRDDFIAGYLGQTAKQTKKLLDSCIGGVLFIDEVYALGPGQEDKDSFSKEALDTLTGFLSEHANDFCCIAAGYEKEIRKCFFAVNPGLESRFPWVHRIEDYTPAELTEILFKMVADMRWEVTADPEKVTELLMDKSALFESAGRDVMTFIGKCKMAHAKRVISLDESHKFRLTEEDMVAGLALVEEFKGGDEEDSSTYMHMYV